MKEYQQQALQTLAEVASPYEGLQHAGFGMMTEVGEILDTYKRHRFYKVPLDKKNLIEEVGDVLWYIAIAYHFLGKEMELPVGVPTEHFTPELDLILGRVGQSASHFFTIIMCYEDSWTEEFIEYDLDKLYKWLNYLVVSELGSTIQECANANITKLSKRYPDKTWTQVAALNRNTENELSHI